MWWFLYNPAFYGILEVEAEINATLERIATLGEVFLVACGGIIYRKGIVWFYFCHKSVNLVIQAD